MSRIHYKYADCSHCGKRVYKLNYEQVFEQDEHGKYVLTFSSGKIMGCPKCGKYNELRRGTFGPTTIWTVKADYDPQKKLNL